MSNDSLKIGDVVILNTGGPKMVVEKIEADGTACVWFDKDEKVAACFSN